MRIQKLFLIVILWLVASLARAQGAYEILQHDTVVAAGSNLTFCIDSTKAYSNFIFSARDPKSNRWTIWARNSSSGKYEPVFTDGYNRMNVVVSADRKEMLYLKYRTQREGAMYYSTLDTAWVCRNNIKGNNEQIVFIVPQFNKNAVYDLDWSKDKKRILYSYGNDQYPSLTRDGDVFEYNIDSKFATNLTNDWQLWSKNCRYAPGSYDFAYSHFANFFDALPTDIFIQSSLAGRQEVTNSIHHDKNYKYCTLTDFYGDYVIYRRGLYFDNKLYRKIKNEEEVLFSTPGYGGIQLDNDLFAATDFYNNIYLFTAKGTIGTIKVSGIKSFAKDHSYNFALDCNTRLNWMGKQSVKVKWSTGDTTYTIHVTPKQNTTYYCTVTANGYEYTDSVRVKAGGPSPAITRNCLTLSTGQYKTYQWLQNGNVIQGARDSVYTPESGGTFAVTVTDKKDRQATSPDFFISNTQADSIKNLNNQVQINADPSTATLLIKAPFIVNMVIVDAAGKIVDRANEIHQINMNNLPDGVYKILLYNNNCLQLKSRKVVKKAD